VQAPPPFMLALRRLLSGGYWLFSSLISGAEKCSEKVRDVYRWAVS
jgi:hypothetical protein